MVDKARSTDTGGGSSMEGHSVSSISVTSINDPLHCHRMVSLVSVGGRHVCGRTSASQYGKHPLSHMTSLGPVQKVSGFVVHVLHFLIVVSGNESAKT